MSTEPGLPLEPAGFTNLDLILSASLSELRLPPRAVNAYKKAGLNFVGQLVQEHPARLLVLPGFGRTSFTQTEEVLSQLGLRFGEDICGWTVERSKLIRRMHLKEVRGQLAIKFGVLKPSYPSAASELEAILSTLVEGRNRDITAKYWGLLGDKPRTLESVGQEFRMTRERVRQITTRTAKQARAMWLPTANCEKLLKIIEALSPLPLDMAEKVIADNQIGDPIRIESLLNMAEVLELSSKLEVIKAGSGSFIDKVGRSPSIQEIIVDFRRATSRSGTVNIDRTSLRLTGGLEERGIIQRVLSGLPETLWLDEERNWSSSTNSERNRLGNTIKKILTVTESVHVSEMRQAALRNHRLSFVPPQGVLTTFAKEVYGCSVSDGIVSRADTFEPVELGENEKVIFDGFVELGSPLPREQLETYCIDKRGMNDNSFYVYLSYSPVVVKIATGIYGLVGAEIPIGTIEQLSVDRKKGARSKHGWDKQGRLWFSTRLSRLTIKMGMFYLPAFVVGLTSGAWSARLPDGTRSGIIEVTEQGIIGLKPILELSGAEPDDVMSLRFDFIGKSVEIEVGDDELFDGAADAPKEVDLKGMEPEDFEEYD